MKRIENYETVQASSGEFARPTAGGYICKIIDVEDVPMNEQGKGDYLRIEYDIADGEFKGYYKEQFDRWGGNWNASFIRSYKEKALGMFKHFIKCIEESNPKFSWDWNETELINQYVGLVLGEEEYQNSVGEIKTKLTVREIKSVEDIRKGNFKIPTIKKLQSSQVQSVAPNFQPVDDEEIPF
jgi:hypothetical protein